MASLVVLAAAASCILLLAASAPLAMATVVYSVGDERGWTVPSGDGGTETYNRWARRNRFQVGDVLRFKYGNDSVLLVKPDDYRQCSTANPASRFTDGDTKFTFDRDGLFYFISGVPGHCQAGQRMVVRVMARSVLAAAPAPVKATVAPAPTPVKATAAPAPAKAPAAAPSVGGASNPVSSAPDSPTYGSGYGSSSSSSSRPMPSRALAASFSYVIVLIAMIWLA